MSWHDLIDDNSLLNYVEGSTANTPEEEIVFEEMSERSSSSSSLVNITTPVEHVVTTTMYDTELLDASVISDDESYSGATIVSSRPSTVVSGGPRLLPPATQPPHPSDWSISDIEDAEEDSLRIGSNGNELESLSMNPSSVDSSVLTEWTATSEVSEVSSGHDDTGDDECSRYSDRAEAIAEQARMLHAIARAQQDDTSNDALIAKLLAAEEVDDDDKYHPVKPSKDLAVLTESKHWLLEAAAIAGAVALTSVAVIKILKGR